MVNYKPVNPEKVDEELKELRFKLDMDKIDRVARTSKRISLTLIPIMFILFVVGTLKLNALYDDVTELETAKQKSILALNTVKFDYEATLNKKQQLEQELMNKYGLSIDSIKNLSTTEVLEKSLSANAAIKTIIDKKRPSVDVSINYFRKSIDDKRLAVELEALGYKFVEKQPKPNMTRQETNALWYGHDVSVEDCKIIALALLRAGIPLKGIRPFRTSATDRSFKANIVEVGASVDLNNKPVLTVDQVTNAREFSR